MSDSFTIVIDDSGHIAAEGRAALRRLAARPGRYRLVPSPTNLVIFERAGTDAPVGRIALAGDVDGEGGLIDVLRFIHQSGWSGQLTVVHDAIRKTLQFDQGDVAMAASNQPEDRVGAILYRAGRITADELDAALSFGRENVPRPDDGGPAPRLGRVLVETGMLTAHDLYQLVRQQVEEIFFSILVMRRGEYYFTRTDEPGPPSRLKLPTRRLLVEGVGRIEELSYFRAKISGSDAIPALRAPPPDEKLPPKEARVLQLVDGRRDVAAIARDSHLGEPETTRILFQLLHTDWVRMLPRSSPPRRAEASPEQYALLCDRYNDAYARIHAAVAARSGQEELFEGLDSFFLSAGEFAPLFVGVSIDVEGRMGREQLLANLEMAPIEDKLDYLGRGLRDLLEFQLFAAGEAVDRQEEAQLHEALRRILQAPAAKG